ncbi:hypothetical protein ACF08B_38555 [Streptomyces sp. NPDC015139]|uniref:hypothetical protein n=1 Tax=Streptomyces sp. NPDC015139 TaxID=3364942 RepID=UPI0037033D0E
MENWDFREWQAALGGLDGRGAALVGLAAAERISGCLGDERFRRHGSSGSEIVTELLRRCWTDAANGEESSPAEIQELVDQLADWSREYTELSLADLFRSYGTPIGEGGSEEDEDADDLEDFMHRWTVGWCASLSADGRDGCKAGRSSASRPRRGAAAAT